MTLFLIMRPIKTCLFLLCFQTSSNGNLKESQYLPTFFVNITFLLWARKWWQIWCSSSRIEQFKIFMFGYTTMKDMSCIQKNGIYLTQRSGLNWRIIQVKRVCSNDMYSLINSRTHFCWGGGGWARVHRRGRHPDRSHHCCHCHSLQWLDEGEAVSRSPGSNWGRAKIQCHSKWNRATDPSWRIDSGWRCTSKPYFYLASIDYRFT